MALSEWGQTPWALNEEWTEEMLVLLLKARVKRMNPPETGRNLPKTSEGESRAELLAQSRMRQLTTPVSVIKDPDAARKLKDLQEKYAG